MEVVDGLDVVVGGGVVDVGFDVVVGKVDVGLVVVGGGWADDVQVVEEVVRVLDSCVEDVEELVVVVGCSVEEVDEVEEVVEVVEDSVLLLLLLLEDTGGV